MPPYSDPWQSIDDTHLRRYYIYGVNLSEGVPEIYHSRFFMEGLKGRKGVVISALACTSAGLP